MALDLVVDTLDAVPEAVKSLYVEADGKFRLDVTGIEDTKGLKSALEKERQAAREALAAKKALEQRFDGIDPDQVKNLMAKFQSKEEADLIAAGKMDQVIEMRTAKQREEAARQTNEALDKAKQADERARKFEQRVLDNHIRAAAAKAGIHAHAIEDALFRGRNMFALDEAGNAVQLGADGKPIYGKDGKTPYSPVEWLEGMKEQAPHWFPAGSSGGGATGNRGDAGTAKTIKRADFDSRDHAERARLVKDGVKIID